jgi:DNA-nicking Smr family endonuclease
MSRRRLSDEEQALWQGFTRAVTPLRRSLVRDGSGATPPKARTARATARAERTAKPAAAKINSVPALAEFDRRLRQRVARGHTTIDARLDLHGMTQKEAHAALASFLIGAQAQNAKLVLVVTGKGRGVAPAGSERGVLRRQVPLWLSLPEFRRFVVSFEEAHVSHGGEGALYLHLRRRSR